MRIVGGRWAGSDLTSPAGRVRPTTEGLRAAWMDALAADLDGARVLDLFAGSGALGLEALSRGAARADFVENGRATLHSLRANVARFRAKRQTRVYVTDALAFLEGAPRGAYDVAFADPPYTSRLAERVLDRWRQQPFSRVLGLEHSAERRLPGKALRLRSGEGAVTLYVAVPWPPDGVDDEAPPENRRRISR